MNGKSGCRGIRFAVGGLWALALGMAFAPSQARAGCGDGLQTLGAGHHAAQPDVRPGSADTEKPAPRPCSGPHCSRAPLAPAPLPVPTSQRTVDDPCALSPLLLLPLSEPLATFPETFSGVPVRRAADVYHPPR
jgi:hypothetical protein